MIKKINVSELVEDTALYPRHAVDGSHVADLARAMRSGLFDDQKYPVVIDKKSKRITDGFHRARAWRQVYGDNSEIYADMQDYADEAAMVRDAVTRNSGHGRKLDRQDQTRSALMLRKHGFTEAEISVTLHTTQATVTHLLTRVVIVSDDNNGEGELIPAKPVAYPGNGNPRTITREQAQVMVSSSGYRTGQTVTQLINELRSGLIEPDAGLRVKLTELWDVLNEVLFSTVR